MPSYEVTVFAPSDKVEIKCMRIARLLPEPCNIMGCNLDC